MKTIVKVQLQADNPNGPALIYDEHCEHLMRQELTQLSRDYLGDDSRGFFEAEFDLATGKWVLSGRVWPPEWAESAKDRAASDRSRVPQGRGAMRTTAR